jgi:hypothetical protein
MDNYGKRALLGVVAVACACGLAIEEAQAQYDAVGSGQVGPPGAREERQDQRAPAARAAEDYSPTGVPVGSFRLFPVLELDEVYNDNIYAASNATGKIGSFIQLIKPSLDLRSDWNNHMLNFFARGTFGFTAVNNTENFQDFSFGTDGRFDIQRDWNVYGGGSFSRLHEDRGTPNVVTSAFEPNKYNQLAGNIGYFQRFNRLSMRLDARIDNYSFVNSGPGPAAGVISNFDRDRTEWREALRVGYDFSPGYQVWARGSLNQRNYNNTVDSQGFTHNSSGYDIVGGVAVDLGGITSFEAFAGYIHQDYRDPRYPVVQGVAFGLTGYWNPIRELFVKPFVRRTIEDSALLGTSAYLNTAAGLDVDYRVRPNVKIDGHFDYSVADYSVSSATAGRYDQYITFRTGVLYYPTREFFVGPSYQFTHRTSNGVNSDFDQNLIMLRLGARL